MRRDRLSRPWHLYALGLVAVVVVVLAVLQIGAPGSSARTSRELVTAENGVVQSTVTGTGNIAAGSDLDVNFKTGGTLQTVYVSAGQHVTQGQLLATLDPTSAQLSVQQAEENLTAAEDQLTSAESGTTSASATSYAAGSGSAEFVSYTKPRPRKTHGSSGTVTTITTITTISPSGTRTSTTHSSGSGGSRSGSAASGSSGAGSGSGSHAGTTTTTTPSPGSIASAQASVYGAEASVNSAETALSETKLYAPISGTITSMANLEPGDSVSAGSTSNAASASSSSSSSSSSGTGGLAGGTTSAGSLGGSGSSSSSSGTGSSSPFVEIVNAGTTTMSISFSESDITKVHVGQPATVTLDALAGVELAAHVASISPVGSSSGGVVSYTATLDIDQTNAQVKPGMSASASVIVGQAQGVTVPNQAVTGTGSLETVNVMKNGKSTSQQVVVGLRGDSRTQIISGLSAGQQLVVTVALPSLSTGTSTTGSNGTLGGGRFGGGGLLGGGGGGLLGGGGFFRRAGGG